MEQVNDEEITVVKGGKWYETGFTMNDNCVMQCHKLSIQSRMLYQIIDMRRMGGATTKISQEYLCWAMGYKRDDSIRKYLQELKDAGLLKFKSQGFKMTNIYYIVPRPWELPIIAECIQEYKDTYVKGNEIDYDEMFSDNPSSQKDEPYSCGGMNPIPVGVCTLPQWGLRISNKKKEENNKEDTMNSIGEGASPSPRVTKQKNLIGRVEYVSNIDNQLLVKSNGYKEYVKLVTNKSEIRGSGKGCNITAYAFKKFDSAIGSKDYSSMTGRDFAYLYREMYEVHYGMKMEAFDTQRATIQMNSFIGIFGLDNDCVVDVLEGLLLDYEELGYRNEQYPSLTLGTLEREAVIKPLMDGKRWGVWENKKQSKAIGSRRKSVREFDGIDYEHSAYLDKLRAETPELSRLAEEAF